MIPDLQQNMGETSRVSLPWMLYGPEPVFAEWQNSSWPSPTKLCLTLQQVTLANPNPLNHVTIPSQYTKIEKEHRLLRLHEDWREILIVSSFYVRPISDSVRDCHFPRFLGSL